MVPYRYRRNLTTALLAGTVLSFSALAPARAFAMEAEVNSTSAFQAYQFSSPWGTPEITRQRFLETLALGVYHLEGGEARASGPEISLKLRVRVNADVGVASNESTYAAPTDTGPNRFVPGLQVAPVDVMYAYVEGRRLAGGWLGFKLGRQYVIDALGWWAFDGGLVRITTPGFVQLEAYAGTEERGDMLLGTPRFEQNGVWRGSRSGFDPTVYSAYQGKQFAPAYGAALESVGPSFIHGRLDYRKVMNQGSSAVYQDPTTYAVETYSGNRTSSERLGYAMDLSSSFAGAKAGLVYDLFSNFLSSYYGQLDVFVSPQVTLGADYDYFKPTFDGDSIFNYFTHNPMTTITGRIAWDPSNRVALAASGGIRSFTTSGNPDAWDPAVQDRSNASVRDILTNFSARYRYESGVVGANVLVDHGDRGHRQGGDVHAEHRFMGGRWTGLARVSVYDFDDRLRPDRSTAVLGYVLGAAFRPSPVAQAMLEWEHDMNQLVGQRYRILAVLNLTVGK